jgi:hypothetical protein
MGKTRRRFHNVFDTTTRIHFELKRKKKARKKCVYEGYNVICLNRNNLWRIYGCILLFATDHQGQFIFQKVENI